MQAVYIKPRTDMENETKGIFSFIIVSDSGQWWMPRRGRSALQLKMSVVLSQR